MLGQNQWLKLPLLLDAQRILTKLLTFKLILSILCVILFVLFFGELVPVSVKAFFFTLSNSVRKILMFLLPFLVFPYLVTSISSMKSKSTYLIGGIALLILVSNFISIMIAYFVGTNVIPALGLNKIIHIESATELMPLFDFNLNPLVEIEITMLISIFVGIFLSYRKNETAINFVKKYMNFSSAFFQKVYVPILPLYVLGTLFKLSHEMDLLTLFSAFGSMILMILATQLSYIFLMFYVGSQYNISKTLSAIKNASSAAIVGFSTMSSIVTMPITLKAAEKNIKDHHIAHLAIGSTVNCHDVGECISLPMIALTLFFISFSTFPDVNTYCLFAFLVAAAQFTGVSVPGGSIIVILPFLTKYLGFTPDMLSLIIAISIFMDPIGTANNVMGNSAFAMIIHRIYEKISNIRFVRGIKAETTTD